MPSSLTLAGVDALGVVLGVLAAGKAAFVLEVLEVLAGAWLWPMTGRDGLFAASMAGGATRNTCSTSITLGLSRPFHLAMSRHAWPWSKAILVSVSPGRTL